MAYRKLLLYGNAPRGVEIRRDVPILESKEVNERRRAERAAAGLTNDFKLVEKPETINEDTLQDEHHYKTMFETVVNEHYANKTNLEWDDF